MRFERRERASFSCRYDKREFVYDAGKARVSQAAIPRKKVRGSLLTRAATMRPSNLATSRERSVRKTRVAESKKKRADCLDLNDLKRMGRRIDSCWVNGMLGFIVAGVVLCMLGLIGAGVSLMGSGVVLLVGVCFLPLTG